MQNNGENSYILILCTTYVTFPVSKVATIAEISSVIERYVTFVGDLAIPLGINWSMNFTHLPVMLDSATVVTILFVCSTFTHTVPPEDACHW